MKKITFLFTFLTITFGFGQNLFVNGDFETGDLTGYTGSYGTDVIQAVDVIEAGTTHGGLYAGRALNWGTGSTSFLYPVNVTPGETYILDFWFTFSSFGVSTNVVIKDFTGDTAGSNLVLTPIIPDNGRNAVNNTNYGCSIASLDPVYDWKEAKMSFTVPAGVTKIRFQYFNSNVGYYKYLDDITLVPEATASIDDLLKYNFKSTPNPARDYIMLSASKTIDKIEIYSILGQQVKNVKLNKTQSSVDVSSLSNGIYIVKAFIEDAVGTYKFIKE